MTRLRRVLRRLTLAMAVAVAVLVTLDQYNPMMGFLNGTPAAVYLYLLCALAAALCLLPDGGGKHEK